MRACVRACVCVCVCARARACSRTSCLVCVFACSFLYLFCLFAGLFVDFIPFSSEGNVQNIWSLCSSLLFVVHNTNTQTHLTGGVYRHSAATRSRKLTLQLRKSAKRCSFASRPSDIYITASEGENGKGFLLFHPD